MMPDLSARIEELTVTLTEQPSVLNTPDELRMAALVHDLLAQMPYFKAHPDLLCYLDARGDRLGRRSVMAVLRGEKDESRRTVICVGHMDTVGVSDYGALRPWAHRPRELAEKLREMENLSPECRRDLESGDYLFGRGVFDMKAGDAVLLALMEFLSADPRAFSGNLIFLGVCDEEGGSAGMLSAVTALRALQDSGDYDFRALLDTDYMTGEYAGDGNKYIYVGTVGKLLPAFYVVGKETHVGESFKGLDPNQIAAAITAEIDLNPDYCDTAEGETTLPPVALRQRDLKPEYSVQTAGTALVYFNYATHCSTPDQVLARMTGAAEKAMDRTLAALQARYDRYCALSRRPRQQLPWRTRVLTFAELCARVRAERGAELDAQMEALAKRLAAEEGLDAREQSLRLVELVHSLWSDRDPAVIVCFFPPYYPHIYVEGTREKERELLAAARRTVAETAGEDRLVWKKFFPYISDLSYAAAPREPRVVAALRDNLPGFGVTYDLPLADMQALDLPVLDIGTFGHDAHKFTERLEKNYSFHVTPELVLRTILNLLEK